MTVDTEALIAAVRAGDIKAAQALLPVDPIVKRAREICARHMGTPATYIAGKMDGWPAMAAVTEALGAGPTATLRMARAACYLAITDMLGADRWTSWRADQFLTGEADQSSLMLDMLDVMRAA